MSHLFSRGLLVVSSLLTCVFLAACALGSSNSPKKYLIVDHTTGRILNSVEVTPGTTRPSRIVSYGPERNIIGEQQLQYDTQGRLASRSIIKNLPGGGVITDLTTYTYKEITDASGKLVRTEQYSSKGEVVQTYYGYDEQGKARGVVEKNGTALMMKDYPQ